MFLSGARYGQGEIDETAAFLEWLEDDNFIFIGYREYEILGEGSERAIRVKPGSGLGVLRDESGSSFAEPVLLSRINDDLRPRVEGGELLVVSKTNRSATVHRRAPRRIRLPR